MKMLPNLSELNIADILFKISKHAWVFGCVGTKFPPINSKLKVTHFQQSKCLTSYMVNPCKYLAIITLTCNII